MVKLPAKMKVVNATVYGNVTKPETSVEGNETKKDNGFPETVFKSSYAYGDYTMFLFVNYRKVANSFSFIIKKGKFNFIYNLTEEEKRPILLAMLKSLSAQELQQLISKVKE